MPVLLSIVICRALLPVFVLTAGWAADDLSAIRAALQRGDLDGAARSLQTRLAQPSDAEAVKLAYDLGLAFGKAGQFDRAESLLTFALAGDPASFKTLYNLGVAASYAGHRERARQVLEAALRQQPQNVDVLYSLAYVHQSVKAWEAAAELLAHASKLAPRRGDVQKLLAISAAELRAYDDAAAAWDRYLSLEPTDDLARRERGAALVRAGQFEKGVDDLQWFVARHATDAAAHYELGAAFAEREPDKAMLHLDRALQIQSDFPAARSSRGGLYYRMGKPEAALSDLEIAARLLPDDAAVLDQLGQTYQALERTSDALQILSKAAERAPGDSKIQLHYGRALADAGRTAESDAVMERFRQLGPAKNVKVPAGLIEYLTLTPEQRAADYRTRVEKAVRDNPDDAATQLRYLKLQLEEVNLEQAGATAHSIVRMKPAADVRADAGRMLLAFHQYALAAELLEPGTLDHAVAVFRSNGAVQGLRLMDRVAPGEEYYLARAQMFLAAGKLQEAIGDLDRAPKSRYAQLLKAGMLQLAGQTEDSLRLCNQIQNRSPEWYAVWLVRGMILISQGRTDESRAAFATATALGARNQPSNLRTFLLTPPADW